MPVHSMYVHPSCQQAVCEEGLDSFAHAEPVSRRSKLFKYVFNSKYMYMSGLKTYWIMIISIV